MLNVVPLLCPQITIARQHNSCNGTERIVFSMSVSTIETMDCAGTGDVLLLSELLCELL